MLTIIIPNTKFTFKKITTPETQATRITKAPTFQWEQTSTLQINEFKTQSYAPNYVHQHQMLITTKNNLRVRARVYV